LPNKVGTSPHSVWTIHGVPSHRVVEAG